MKRDEKILCLGDNSSNDAWAHTLTKKIAEENESIFRGQINDVNQDIVAGYYHVDLVTLSEREILSIIQKFNDVVLLDQSIDKYSHAHVFTSTWKFIKQLKQAGHHVHVINSKNMDFLDYWDDLLKKNKSFCLYPWVKSVSYNDHHTLCTQSLTPVTKLSDMKNWKDDPGYTVVRNKMLKGQKIPNCTACYDQEAVGENVSIRRHETIEWAALLHLKSINELKDITSPSYFELRFSNKCNITCRSCSGHFSHLIQKENDQIKDEKFQTIVDKQAFSSTGGDELIQWDNIKRVYIGGGESTVQPELYRFMRKCISNDNTDFEFRIGTNGVRISDKLFDLFKHFKNLTFSLSIDGTPKVDEYIRWGTEANDKYSNMQRLKNQGHPIALNFVMSIWNISHIGEILQYFDKAYPGSPVHMNKAGYNGDIISPFLFPDKDVVKESIAKAKKTQVYFSNEQRTKFLIDSVDKFYSSDKSVDFEKLKKFFYYNDTLDRVRGVALKDYIPELERCRKFVT